LKGGEIIVKKLYVGNLNFDTTEEDLKQFVEEFVPTKSVQIIRDKFSNRSKGFGFVEIESDDTQEIVGKLNGAEFKGRKLRVDEAKPLKKDFDGGNRM